MILFLSKRLARFTIPHTPPTWPTFLRPFLPLPSAFIDRPSSLFSQFKISPQWKYEYFFRTWPCARLGILQDEFVRAWSPRELSRQHPLLKLDLVLDLELLQRRVLILGSVKFAM